MSASPSNNDSLPPSICLALIHNHDEERNSRIRPEIARLAALLSSGHLVQTIEVAYQATLRPHDTWLAFKRDAAYQVLEYQWKKYRRLDVSIFRATVDAIKFLKKKYQSKNRDAVTRWRRSSAIETTVTDKHIRAWDSFLESDCDILMCFEDDAVFRANSTDKLILVIQEVVSMSRQNNIYADLAGGCALSDLFIEHLIERKDDIFTYYQKPVTNTACAYLLNRPLVTMFKETLVRLPSLRLIGIDWMMNRLLMELEKQGEICQCFHTDPTALKHGSTTGDFVAWER